MQTCTTLNLEMFTFDVSTCQTMFFTLAEDGRKFVLHFLMDFTYTLPKVVTGYCTWLQLRKKWLPFC